MPGDDFARPMNRRLSLPERLAFRQRFVRIFSLGERGVVGVRRDARLARRSLDSEGLLLTRLGPADHGWTCPVFGMKRSRNAPCETFSF